MVTKFNIDLVQSSIYLHSTLMMVIWLELADPVRLQQGLTIIVDLFKPMGLHPLNTGKTKVMVYFE
jgi:hypothetical protein